MSDAATDSTTAPDENSGPKELREAFDRVKAQLAERDTVIETLTSAARANEFDKAGIPTDVGWAQQFRNNYQGDLTPEAIKAELDNWGIPQVSAPAQEQTPAQDPAQTAIDQELSTLQTAQGLRAEAPAQVADPMTQALLDLENAGTDTNENIRAVLSEYGQLAG